MAQATSDVGREPHWRIVIGQWRRKLNQTDDPLPAFLPVHVVANEIQEPAARGIEIVLANGRCLRVQPGFDPDTLVKRVDLLEAERSSC